MTVHRPRAIILTGADDATADFLEQRLLERSIPYLRLNTEYLLEELALNVAPLSRGGGCLTWRGDVCSLESATGVWYRRPARPRTHQNLSEQEVHLASREMFSALWGILLVQPGRDRWISPPDAVAQADFKLEQLARAAGLGIPVPASLVTTDVQQARSFLRAHDAVVAKAVHEGYANVGGGATVTWTSIITEELLEKAALAPVPMILQEAIHPKEDLRVTIVDEQLWCAKISYDDDDSPSGIDWRASSTIARSELTQIDNELALKLIGLVRSYGLRFGAIDLVRRDDGRTYFLELNASGQWGWLELEAGFPIRDALIDGLTQPIR